MHRSLNFLIETTCQLDDAHPGGFSFTREFESVLSATATISQSTDNWRDVGWQFSFTVDNEEYLAVVSCTAKKGELLFQVSPARTSNAILRLLGYGPSASDAGLARRLSEISELLASNPQIKNVLSAYDRMPG
jgi:flagellar motor switch protein FliM